MRSTVYQYLWEVFHLVVVFNLPVHDCTDSCWERERARHVTWGVDRHRAFWFYTLLKVFICSGGVPCKIPRLSPEELARNDLRMSSSNNTFTSPVSNTYGKRLHRYMVLPARGKRQYYKKRARSRFERNKDNDNQFSPSIKSTGGKASACERNQRMYSSRVHTNIFKRNSRAQYILTGTRALMMSWPKSTETSR